MSKYRKKPVEVEAMQFTRDSESAEFVAAWCSGALYRLPDDTVSQIRIGTLEGEMVAAPGDWIIRGVQGEFYPCKPDIFEATYEPVQAEQ